MDLIWSRGTLEWSSSKKQMLSYEDFKENFIFKEFFLLKACFWVVSGRLNNHLSSSNCYFDGDLVILISGNSI